MALGSSLQTQFDPFTYFPLEVCIMVAENLDPRQTAQLRKVSKHWNFVLGGNPVCLALARKYTPYDFKTRLQINEEVQTHGGKQCSWQKVLDNALSRDYSFHTANPKFKWPITREKVQYPWPKNTRSFNNGRLAWVFEDGRSCCNLKVQNLATRENIYFSPVPLSCLKVPDHVLLLENFVVMTLPHSPNRLFIGSLDDTEASAIIHLPQGEVRYIAGDKDLLVVIMYNPNGPDDQAGTFVCDAKTRVRYTYPNLPLVDQIRVPAGFNTFSHDVGLVVDAEAQTYTIFSCAASWHENFQTIWRTDREGWVFQVRAWVFDMGTGDLAPREQVDLSIEEDTDREDDGEEEDSLISLEIVREFDVPIYNFVELSINFRCGENLYAVLAWSWPSPHSLDLVVNITIMYYHPPTEQFIEQRLMCSQLVLLPMSICVWEDVLYITTKTPGSGNMSLYIAHGVPWRTETPFMINAKKITSGPFANGEFGDIRIMERGQMAATFVKRDGSIGEHVLFFQGVHEDEVTRWQEGEAGGSTEGEGE